MKTGMLLLILLAVMLAGATLMLLAGRQIWERVAGPFPDKTIDFTDLRRNGRPNSFLICPPGLCRGADAESPVYPVTVAALEEAFLSVIRESPRLRETAAEVDARQYDFVQYSRFMGFPDSITIRFIDLGQGRSSFAIFSRAHIGYSDFGVNRARVRGWIATLEQRLPAARR